MQSPAEWVVVIPCVNEAAAIFSLVECVRRQVAHVIVVDDGSTDATGALAARAEIPNARVWLYYGSRVILEARKKC